VKVKIVIGVLAVAAMLTGTASAGAAATATLFGDTGSGSSPSDLVIDSSDNIFTANGNSTISKVTSAGVVNNAWASGVLSSLTTIAIGPGGSVYVSAGSGSGANKVQKYSSSGGAPAAEPSTGGSNDRPSAMTVDSSGNIYFTLMGPNKLGKITSGGTLTSNSISYQPTSLITDSAGNLYVTDNGANTVHKYDTSFTEVTGGGWPASVGTPPGKMAVDATYLYVAYQGMGASGGVSRVKLSDASVTSAWATQLNGLFGVSPIVVKSDGTVYVGAGSGGSSKKIYAITSSGTVSTLATLDFQPFGLALDSLGNLYTLNLGFGFPSGTPGVYKITLASPTPTPTPSSNTSTTTGTASTTTSGALPKGPALKVADVPKEITVDIGSSDSGTVAPNQPITAEVPCAAPEGTTLSSCTVNITAPQTVLLGQGDGISVRADKRVSIGKATVNAKTGKKIIVVKVKINQTGRKALQRNLKITAKVGLTAVTVARQSSTGEATTEMQLPTQLLSPQAGIFSSNSTTLNAAGVQFVNRLAALLPKAPKKMVFIGFADNTGVPGDNRWLGDRRAKAVRAALEAKGIVAVKSSIETKAARSPRDDNAKQSGRERNRRVSIRITY
jgi:outer membrane protein OmpA-like peptidoglycan-associated protein/sugar lactone lactonase YvrE